MKNILKQQIAVIEQKHKASVQHRRKQLDKELQQLKDQIKKEKEQWLEEKRALQEKFSHGEELFQLNVSGVTEGFLIDKNLLCSVPNTALEAKFSGRHAIPKINGQVYLNRNPKIFSLLLDYLRMGQKTPKLKDEYEMQLFEEELSYWAFDQLPTPEESERANFFKDVQENIFDKEPQNVQPEIMAKWKELGPFDALLHLSEKDKYAIDISQPISVNKNFDNGAIIKSGQLNQQDRLVGIGRKEGWAYLFEGLWDSKFKPVFLRSLEKRDGSYYIGHYKDFERHGRGKLVLANGEVREGIW